MGRRGVKCGWGPHFIVKASSQKRADPLGGKSGKVYVIYPFRFFYQKQNDSPPPSVSGWGVAGRERDSESFERGA